MPQLPENTSTGRYVADKMHKLPNVGRMLQAKRNGIMFGALFLSGYGYTCHKARTHPSECFRIGVAGSLSAIACDSTMHVIDTINIRSKVVLDKVHQNGLQAEQNKAKNIKTFDLVKNIYKTEGFKGFVKGYTACLFGATIEGFSYCFLYKLIKQKQYEYVGPNVSQTWVFASSSIMAEIICLSMYFPFDLVKTRLQSKNHIYKYKSVYDAFAKEIKQDGVKSLYQGAPPFMMTSLTYIAIQFTFYEAFMVECKRHFTSETFTENERKLNILGSFTAGCVAATFTNPLECITVNKQTQANFNIKAFVKKEGVFNVITKGMLPRVVQSGCQSIFFFAFVFELGKFFNVKLLDE